MAHMKRNPNRRTDRFRGHKYTDHEGIDLRIGYQYGIKSKSMRFGRNASDVFDAIKRSVYYLRNSFGSQAQHARRREGGYGSPTGRMQRNGPQGGLHA